MEILLVRHGQISGDPHKHYELPITGSLTELGERQAAAMAAALANTHIDRIYCSPLGRALQTAQALAKGRELTPVIHKYLVEWMPADLINPGVPIPADVPAEYPPERAWKTPHGEGTLEFAARIIPPFIETLSANGVVPGHGGFLIEPGAENLRLAFVAHGGTLGRILGYILGFPITPYGPFSFELTGVARIKLYKRIDVWYPALVIEPPNPHKVE